MYFGILYWTVFCIGFCIHSVHVYIKFYGVSIIVCVSLVESIFCFLFLVVCIEIGMYLVIVYFVLGFVFVLFMCIL